ncbi:MAG TPA: hypothetical protein VG105_08980 [Paraburkholderia sp.]|jgi:hypothetical protein|nr:hypothetical protein [Paraburkholderia sp.]
MLSPDDVLRQLETRVDALERELARLDALTEEANALQLPRLFLLELELIRVKLVVELEWVRSLVADLKAGTITWSEEWLEEISQHYSLPSDATSYKLARPLANKETKA